MEELRGTEREKGLPLQAYMTDGYFSTTQWESFRFQVKTVKNLLDRGTVLEIGCGGGYASSILNSLGLSTETLDINENLNPTYVGDISKADYEPPKLYDCVLCAEVLEHIPFELFDICLANIKKTTQKYAVITLPNSFRRRFVFGLRVNGHYREVWFGTKKTPLPSIHYWQLNSDSYCSYQEILSHIERFFEVKNSGPIMANKHCSLMGNEYHYYYVLEVRN